MISIRSIESGWDVSAAVEQLAAHPEVWNQHTLRTARYGTPHRGIDDVWVRYHAWERYQDDPDAFNGPHISEWYPVISTLPALWSLARRVKRRVGGKELGGVLVTRLPPGGGVKPHIDTGWHASYYEKYAVQIKGTPEQAFCFEDSELRPLPGDVYTFDNSRLHWVVNDSNQERITLIVCVKRWTS